ncbi:MAG: hypothetical protein AAF581_19495 [Planctomycetota bacterium]
MSERIGEEIRWAMAELNKGIDLSDPEDFPYRGDTFTDEELCQETGRLRDLEAVLAQPTNFSVEGEHKIRVWTGPKYTGDEDRSRIVRIRYAERGFDTDAAATAFAKEEFKKLLYRRVRHVGPGPTGFDRVLEESQ